MAGQNEDITIRRLDAGDAAEVEAFLRAQPPEYLRFFHALPVDRAGIASLLAARRRDVYEGFHQGSLAALFLLRGWDAGHEIPSFGLVVDHSARRTGLLPFALDRAAEITRQAGAPYFMVKIHPENITRRTARHFLLTAFAEEPATGNVIYHRYL